MLRPPGPPPPRLLLPTRRGRQRVARKARARMVGAEVAEHRLDNGLRVLVAERHSDPVVASVLYYRCGSRNEAEHEAGASHFLEHMMFKGSERYGKGRVDEVTAALGGQNNAFTGYDHTAYWFEFASDRWETALDIERDRMLALTLDPAEFDSERQVVLEELAMGEDDPWRVLARRVEAAVFGRHPYGRPIIGTPEALRLATPASMRTYYERFYHPANATLVVCGDVEPQRALAAVQERFGDLRPGPEHQAVDVWRPAVEEPVGEQRLTMRWDDRARRLCMAWPTARVGSDADYALDVLMMILASGRTSRLQSALVYDGQFAIGLSANNDSRVEHGAFWLFTELNADTNPMLAEAVIDEELERLATKAPSQAEMRRARAMLLASEAFDGEAVSDLAEELGEWAVDWDWRASFDGGERHARVTPRDVKVAAATLLTPDRRVIGWCLPSEPSTPQPTSGARRAKKKKRSKRSSPATRKQAQRKKPKKKKAARRESRGERA